MEDRITKSKSDGATAASGTLENQMDQVLQLLDQRIQGDVSTAEVETAVSDILTTIGSRPKPLDSNEKKSKANIINQKTSKNSTVFVPAVIMNGAATIQGDKGNYDDSSDDDDDDDYVDKNEEKDASTTKKKTKKRRRGNDDTDILKSNKKYNVDVNISNSKDDNTTQSTSLSIPHPPPEYHDIVSQIPMGKEAGKMMTAFGDGPYPVPPALEKALLGTRKALQVSIMDARKVRRRLQKEYQEARATVLAYNPTKNGAKKNPTIQAAAAWVAETEKESSNDNYSKDNDKNDDKNDASQPPSSNKNEAKMYENEKTEKSKKQLQQHNEKKQYHSGSIDPKLLYRALSEGTDKLSYAHKCGFHMEELSHLYPEEMRAYDRWNEMHEEYNASKSDEKEKLAEVVGKDAPDDGATPTPTAAMKQEEEQESNADKEPDGGHLRERAAHFDFRTEKMKGDWYIEYAKVRQGSFLPNTLRVRRTPAEIEWDRLRKIKKGRHAAGEWENMSGRSVRFLHWLGFDPPNLYPPDDDTTQALAFLAYDRLGRIIEKAIFLRNDETNDCSFSNRSFWELPRGKQLTLEDIERALQDPDIKPATIYGTEDLTGSSSIQLYFGPGWEDRLELEMEEMIASAKGTDHHISEDERMVRNHEMDLLAKISAPPKNDNAFEELVQNRKELISSEIFNDNKKK
mmetsp:Transcript_46790/g.53101  ORF Transcript_46790/g.53101 Transcript_46790/m.53101 type:complete len:684 (-) Transcript_46790:279-2330(-)